MKIQTSSHKVNTRRKSDGGKRHEVDPVTRCTVPRNGVSPALGRRRSADVSDDGSPYPFPHTSPVGGLVFGLFTLPPDSVTVSGSN